MQEHKLFWNIIQVSSGAGLYTLVGVEGEMQDMQIAPTLLAHFKRKLLML